MERRGGEELNLKGREDQIGAKLADKHNMHRRKHKRAVERVKIQRPGVNDHRVGLADP